MLIKYASADIIGLKSSGSKIREASLSKFADYDNYRTDDDYLYVRVRAISSRVNKNHDGWPSAELEKSYRTFIGKPIFVDHHNHDPQKARGVIVDAQFHNEDEKTSSLDPYYASPDCDPLHKPPVWVELLLEVDAKNFPRLAKAIVSGDIDSVSMGANVEESKCSHCDNVARTSEEFCKHIVAKGAQFDYVDKSGRKTSKKSYENCFKIGFFEISFVFDPADETALVKDIKSKTASVKESEKKHVDAWSDKRNRQYEHIKKQYMDEGKSEEEAKELAAQTVNKTRSEKGEAKEGHKTADRGNAVPQSNLPSAPEEVDTLRQEKPCPVCGSTLENGSCEICGYMEPPEGMDDPDLEKAKEMDQLKDNQENAIQMQNQPQNTTTSQPPSNVMSGMKNKVANSSNQQGGRINTSERPILPAAKQNSDNPKNVQVVKDHGRPTHSKLGDSMDTHKLADGATAEGGAEVQADMRVDTMGVGGVDAVDEATHENVEKAMPQTGGPATDTWSGNEGDSLGQQDPVTSESDTEVHAASTHEAAGFPDHDPAHVELDAPLKEEVGDKTMTFGTDPMHVGDPVTKQDSNEVGGPMGEPLSQVRSHIIKSMKLAETEVELGLTNPDSKFERAAELEEESAEALDARLDTLARVKTAGLAKQAPTKVAATRMPSLSKRVASSQTPIRDESDLDDSAIFMR